VTTLLDLLPGGSMRLGFVHGVLSAVDAAGLTSSDSDNVLSVLGIDTVEAEAAKVDIAGLEQRTKETYNA
jgi:hypothetical protein